MHLHLALVTWWVASKNGFENTWKNANLGLKCLAKHLRVSTFCEEMRSSVLSMLLFSMHRTSPVCHRSRARDTSACALTIESFSQSKVLVRAPWSPVYTGRVLTRDIRWKASRAHKVQTGSSEVSILRKGSAWIYIYIYIKGSKRKMQNFHSCICTAGDSDTPTRKALVGSSCRGIGHPGSTLRKHSGHPVAVA